MSRMHNDYDEEHTLAVGAELLVAAEGRIFHVLESNLDEFEVNIDNSGWRKVSKTFKISPKFDNQNDSFKQVIIKNIHATDSLTTRIVIGFGEVEDSRLTSSSSTTITSTDLIADTNTSVADKVIATATVTSVSAADTTRKEIFLQPVTLGAGWRVGDNNIGASRGILIPDSGMILATTAEVFIYQNSGGNATIAVNSLTKVP